MQEVRFHDYGGPEVLVVERVPRPQPQADQVLIRLVAAGVNPTDWKMRAGMYQEFMPLPLPATLGVEGSGFVHEVGSDVTNLHVGQAVYGPVGSSYAEYTVTAASDIYQKPANITFEEAASVPLGALTAWSAIQAAQIKPGSCILIHGGAGGVGLYAVQLAKWKGAHVIATASAANLDFVKSLGANEVIDYGKTKFEAVVKDVDAVIDTVGGDMLERSLPVIRPNGIFVTIAARVAKDAGKAQGVKTMSVGRASTEQLAALSELLELKKVKAFVGAVFPLKEARQAHELSQTGHGRGRIILLTA